MIANAFIRRSLGELKKRFADLAAALPAYGLKVKRLYLIEYPDGTRDSLGSWRRFPGALSGFNAGEAKWAHDKVLLPLNDRLESNARRYGWSYVGGPEASFRRHGYSSDAPDRWRRTLEESRDLQGNIDGTLHPDARGHQEIKRALLDALDSSP